MSAVDAELCILQFYIMKTKKRKDEAVSVCSVVLHNSKEFGHSNESADVEVVVFSNLLVNMGCICAPHLIHP